MKNSFALTTLITGTVLYITGSVIGNEGMNINPEASTKKEHPDTLLAKTNVGLLKEAIKNGLVNTSATHADFDPYYSKEYIQHVDGKTLNYDEFLAHMDDLHKSLSSLEIEFLDIVTQGDKVATRHMAHAIRTLA